MKSTPETIIIYAKTRLNTLYDKTKFNDDDANRYLEVLCKVFPDNSAIVQMLVTSVEYNFRTELIPLIRNCLNVPDSLTNKEAIAYVTLLGN